MKSEQLKFLLNMINYPLEKLCQEFNSVSHSCFLPSGQHWALSILIFFLLIDLKSNYLLVLMYISLIMSEFEHILIFLLVIYTYFSVNSVVCFFLHIWKSFLFFFLMLRSLSFIIQQMWAPPSPLFVIYKLQTFRLGSPTCTL